MYALDHRSPDQDAALDEVLARCAALGHRGAAVFDLDGCLFDNRPRQVQILRVWAALNDEVALGALEVEHLQDWSMRAAFERAGLAPERAAALAERARPFWERWFFDDAYIALDRAFPGAPRLVRQVAATGVSVLYLTGRTDDQRVSTLVNLRRHGFPIDDDGRHLVTKPGPEESDQAFKRRAFEEIARASEVASFLDNEPAHIDFAASRFPGAAVVWVRTDHSPGAEAPRGVREIRGYLRTSDEATAD